MRQLIHQAMQCPDDFVVEFDYCDSHGKPTHRVASPIRFMGADRMLALCLSREAPRQFYLRRCTNLQLRRANDYVMPVAMGS